MHPANCAKGIALGIVLLLVSAVASQGAPSEDPTFSAGLGFEFASGSYGTGTRTESVYAPFTAALFPTERLRLAVEIPFVYQSNSAVNTGVYRGAGGQMMHAQQQRARLSGSMGGGSMGSGTMTSGSGSTVAGGGYGIGDITAKASYLLVPEGELMPKVVPSLTVKFPSGDSGRGLGTGAFDEGGSVELSKWFGDWYAFTEGGYIFQGRSAVLPVQDYFSYDAGAGRLLGERLLPMLIVKGSTPPVAGSGALLELRLKLKYRLAAATLLEGYLSKGMTRNSPEYGSGIAVSFEF